MNYYSTLPVKVMYVISIFWLTEQEKHFRWSDVTYLFLHKVMKRENGVKHGMDLSTLLRYAVHSTSAYLTGYINLTNDFENGLINVGKYYFQVSRKIITGGENPQYQLIVADLNGNGNKKRMTVLTAESVESELVEMDCSGMRENVIIDLNEEGRRWEGGELNGKPFGFSREYSEDGNLVYEGFVFEGMKVCFGKEWNDDGNNNCLMYEGGYCNGERWGKGKSYDLDGNVDFEGELMNNVGITGNEKDLMNDLIVPMWIEEFVIGNGMFNNDRNITTLHFSPLLVRLKRIEIGNYCFDNVREFVIDGLKSMEGMKIGEGCFRRYFKIYDDGLCRITNCPNLRQLEIGDYSFEDFESFEISNVHSIQSIKFGNKSFSYSKNFVIDGYRYLRSVEIGDHCFSYNKIERDDGVFRVVNCPNLCQLEVGDGSFASFKTIVISNVCSLQSIKFGNSCFTNVSEFVIDCLLSLEDIDVGDCCFGIGYNNHADGVFRITNCPDLLHLDIGENSSGAFQSFELSNVDSLQSITLGGGCFQSAEILSLKGEWKEKDVIVLFL